MTDANDAVDGPLPKEYPSQGVPTKVDRRVLPLLRMLKEWTGIKQYRMIMLLVVNEVRAHPALVAALPPDYLEGLQGLEEELVLDQAKYARWQAKTAPAARKSKTAPTDGHARGRKRT